MQISNQFNKNPQEIFHHQFMENLFFTVLYPLQSVNSNKRRCLSTISTSVNNPLPCEVFHIINRVFHIYSLGNPITNGIFD